MTNVRNEDRFPTYSLAPTGEACDHIQAKDAQYHATHLSASEWCRQQALHQEILAPFCEKFRSRRSHHVPHPVYDFLFTYYRFSSLQLQQWHPGLGVHLQEASPPAMLPFQRHRFYISVRPNAETGYWTIDPRCISLPIIRQAAWTLALTEKILSRTPRFACHGLHEWAMVYRADTVRHAYPLRLSSTEIAETVESLSISCSHFDAFRFFTPQARSLNVLQPTLESRLHQEQAGCLHANMDLYKWAYKLSPWIPSDLIRECFLLARDAREIDMRASPYDLRKLGFEPIPIENREGRLQYEALQRSIAARAQPLRQRLAACARIILDHAPEASIEATLLHESKQPDY